MSDVARRLADVRRGIERACERAGRDPEEVTLVGVTKTVDADTIRQAIDAGLAHLGENRLQEAVPKMRALSDRAPVWHFIGHLQRNKARRAVELFDRIESVDSLRLGRALDEAADEIGRELRVFVQANVGGEESKHGVALDEIPALVDELERLPRLTVVGLMTIPPPRDDRERTRADFREIAGLFRSLARERPALQHLSMGMSADYEIAIEEGATEVRVGRTIFGERRG